MRFKHLKLHQPVGKTMLVKKFLSKLSLSSIMTHCSYLCIFQREDIVGNHRELTSEDDEGEVSKSYVYFVDLI